MKMAKKKTRNVRSVGQRIKDLRRKLFELENKEMSKNIVRNMKILIESGKFSKDEERKVRALIRNYNAMVKAKKSFKSLGIPDGVRISEAAANDILSDEIFIKLKNLDVGEEKSETSGQDLIDDSERFWDSYCENPSTHTLDTLREHLNAMKISDLTDVKKAHLKMHRKVSREGRLYGY
jgi:hypothetical protein